MGKGITSFGGAVEQTADTLYKKLDEARDYTETAKGSLYVADENNKLALEMTTGTTIGADGKPRRRSGTPEDMKYYEDRQKNILETAKGFHTSKDGELRASLAYQRDAIGTKNTIQNAWIKGMIADGQAATEVWLDKVSDQYALTRSPKALEEMNKIVENAKLKGFYDSKQAKNLLEATLEKSNWNAFTQLAKTEGIEAARDAVANKEIKLTQEQADKSLSYLNNLKNLQDKDAVQTKISGRFAYTQALASGQESLYNPSPKFQSVIDNDPMLSEAYNHAIKSKKSFWAGKSNEDYVNAVRRASEAKSADSLSALTASAILEGKLNAEQMGAYLFYANNRARTLQLTEKDIFPVDVSTEEATKQTMVDAGLNSIIRWSRTSGADVALHSKVTAQYLQDVQNNKGSPFDLVASAVRKANIELNPDIINYPKEGQMFVDALGRMGIAFPDGRVQSMGTPVTKSTKPSAKATTQGDDDESFESAKGFKK